MRNASSDRGQQGGNSGPGPGQVTIAGAVLQPQHWWNRT